MMSFHEWRRLVEVGTDTSDIAIYARPIFPLIRRGAAPAPKRKRRRKKKGHAD